MNASFFKKLYKSLALFAALVVVSSAALAGGMDLMSAKKSGLVGEKPDGMVAAVLPNPSGDISALVAQTNQGRLEIYKQTAAGQGIPVSEVGKIAAKKIFDLAAPGEFLMIDGQWQKK